MSRRVRPSLKVHVPARASVGSAVSKCRSPVARLSPYSRRLSCPSVIMGQRRRPDPSASRSPKSRRLPLRARTCCDGAASPNGSAARPGTPWARSMFQRFTHQSTPCSDTTVSNSAGVVGPADECKHQPRAAAPIRVDSPIAGALGPGFRAVFYTTPRNDAVPPSPVTEEKSTNSEGFFTPHASMASIALAGDSGPEDLRAQVEECARLALGRAFAAARHNRRRALEAQIRQGFDVNEQDSDGNTVLLVACRNGNKGVAKCALRFGANIDHRSAAGLTAVDTCAKYGHKALKKYLISKGASQSKDKE